MTHSTRQTAFVKRPARPLVPGDLRSILGRHHILPSEIAAVNGASADAIRMAINADRYGRRASPDLLAGIFDAAAQVLLQREQELQCLSRS
jgi:hypothetical protein